MLLLRCLTPPAVAADHVQGVSGFLTSSDYATYYGAASPALLPGTLLDVVVVKPPAAGPDGAIVQVRGGEGRGKGDTQGWRYGGRGGVCVNTCVLWGCLLVGAVVHTLLDLVVARPPAPGPDGAVVQVVCVCVLWGRGVVFECLCRPDTAAGPTTPCCISYM